MSERRVIDCPVCHATPETRDVRVIVASLDGDPVEISHTKDCVDYPPDTRDTDEPTA